MKTHRRDLGLDRKGNVTGLLANDRIDKVARGDVIRWSVTSACARKVTLSIGNFARPDRFKNLPKECRDTNPFEGRSRLRASVKPRSSAAIQGRIRADAHYPRTYKYDILVNGKVALDPEIEIENP